MSERKVLNKYFPPDFDPSKIPRARQSKNRQFTVRLMAPCNMKCNTCGEYIYKGKKFNARKEDVENDTYLGIRIYRFYIKCTRCLAEISFKTDPQSTDYIIEAGATRNFMALKLAEEQAEREEQAEKEDEATNPMKLLEKRTQASRNEMAVLEALEELKELNQRQVKPDYETLLGSFDVQREVEKQQKAKQEQDDEDLLIRSVFDAENKVIKRIYEEPLSSSDEDEEQVISKKQKFIGEKPTDILTSQTTPSNNGPKVVEKSIGLMGINKKMLVKRKVPEQSTTLVKSDVSPTSQTTIVTTTPITTTATTNTTTEKEPEKKNSALSLLGGYGSDSNTGSESD